MRRLEPALFGTALAVADALALAGAIPLAYWLRFGTGLLATPLGTPPLAAYLATAPVVAALGMIVLHQNGLYRRNRPTGWLRDLARGGKAIALLGVLLAAGAFFYRDFSFSRALLVIYLGTATPLFVIGRRFAAGVHRWLRARDIGVERVALAGSGEVADRLAANIASGPGTGLRLVLRLSDAEWRGEGELRPLRAMRVRSLVEAQRIDRFVVADASLTPGERVELVETCHAAGARCDFVPDLYEMMLGRARLEEIDGVPLVGARLHPLGRIDRIQKRALDLVASASSLIIFSPLFGLLALLVRVDSPGPVLYRQERVGRDGRRFSIYKFRSMPVDAEVAGPRRSSKEDRRATRMGRILRRTSLDELPQLWNVLRGQMSLVGPRPERPYFVDSFREDVPRYLERHGVKSGLTGWAQVNGLRGDTSIEERTRYDIWYVENWSLALDLKIVVLTAFRFLFQEEAY
jgi:exopolysaccharide biosynthesis polyprenyl glycosylphosphotransferase